MVEDNGKAEGSHSASHAAGPNEAKPSAAPVEVPSRRQGGGRGSRSAGAQRTGALLLFALAVGGAAGWFAKHAHARTGQTSPEAGAAASCEVWEQEICEGVGEEALACYEAKAAANLLPPAACDAALEAVPETLARAAAGREVCNTVIERLCTDLGPETPTCSVVREKTQLFPAERCQEMLDNYDQVIGELRLFQEQMSPGGLPPPGVEPPAEGQEPGEPGAPAQQSAP